MSDYSLKPLPELLSANYQRHLQQFQDALLPELQLRFSALQTNKTFLRQLQWVWAGSEFAAAVCRKNPEEFLVSAENNALSESKPETRFEIELREILNNQLRETEVLDAEDCLARTLRQYRNRELLRIIWRDLSRQADLLETTRDLSALADACIRCSLEVLHPIASAQWGEPVGRNSGVLQQLIVIAMGKLGAGELNLSSDIDLIFAYPEEGETRGDKQALSNQEFFTRLGQRLIKALDLVTADGFVFRVDMRLRPYGQSGALVYSFDALEEYYQTQGRAWERYAMIKARVMTGEPTMREQLASMLRSFTFRKYIDFTAIESLRDMKALINREVGRKGKTEDVKLGAGGIREVEFIAQAFQLIRGGRDPRFQNPRLKSILNLLEEEKLLPGKAVDQLWNAYQFLRNTEHALQAWRDQQTQALPSDDEGRYRIAALMACGSREEFFSILDEHRQAVRRIFDEVAAPENDGGDTDLSANEHAVTVWQLAATSLTDVANDEEYQSIELTARTRLRALAYVDDESTFKRLHDLCTSRGVTAMQQDARARLDALMPLLIADCGSDETQDYETSGEVLRRVVAIVEAVVRRSVYLVLLIENPGARQQLVKLCAASPWVASELALYPALLDELLDTRTLYTPPERDLIADELRQQMLRIPVDDLEAQMDALRYFRRAHGLRVAACEIIGALPLMKVSDYLTWLAEVILDKVLAIAWEQMIERHGKPGSNTDTPPDFLIVGYGKLGGLELGHGSDLDLVFIHDSDSSLATDGERPIDNETFFTRLGQRIIHILSAHTTSGTLYEIDMRLRPSGNSGFLVSSLAAFEKYQLESAWTWEHQALVRARPVGGNTALAARFEALRALVLSRKRDLPGLKGDVISMREKMRAQLSAGENNSKDNLEAGDFDLKQDVGGIVDIEFMVQFMVLAQSHSHPELTRWTDNIRILGDLAELGLLSSQEANSLCEAYKGYRAAGHRRQLQEETVVVPATEFAHERAVVATAWERLLVNEAC